MGLYGTNSTHEIKKEVYKMKAYANNYFHNDFIECVERVEEIGSGNAILESARAMAYYETRDFDLYLANKLDVLLLTVMFNSNYCNRLYHWKEYVLWFRAYYRHP